MRRSGRAELLEEALPPPKPVESKGEGRADGTEREEDEDQPENTRAGGRRFHDSRAVCWQSPAGGGDPSRDEQIERADCREDDRGPERQRERDPLRMQDLPAFVRKFIVDPLTALVHAFHEARALQLLEMLQERRLAQAKEVAQIRDRLPSCVETFQHLDPDIRRKGAEAFLVQRDLASAGVHAHEPWARGFMNDSLRFGRNLTIRVVAAPPARETPCPAANRCHNAMEQSWRTY